MSGINQIQYWVLKFKSGINHLRVVLVKYSTGY